MHLISVSLHGYRRFKERTKLDLDSKLIALVGPNEAGKTTLLKALASLNNSESLASSGPAQDLTRGSDHPADHRAIEATYLLDAEDHGALEDIPEAGSVRWLHVYKTLSGRLIYRCSPRPKRDKRLRGLAQDSAASVLDRLTSRTEPVESDSPLANTLAIVEELVTALSERSESYPGKSLDLVLKAAPELERAIGAGEFRPQMEHLTEILSELHAEESKPHPHTSARKLLMQRRPEFLFFSDDQRFLASKYDLRPYFIAAVAKRVDVPSPLANLCRAARLDLNGLHEASQQSDGGRVETLLLGANDALKELLAAAWSQSEVTVRLRLDGPELHILVGAIGSHFVQIAERSDGLRQFLALLAFMSRERTSSGAVAPIVLIDEAETHLHYDAQADLVQMLARQKLADKVIYTTHSMGALPEDLGCGVRLIEAEGDSSRVNNWFWSADVPGFSPLLFGMGAATLAFIPIRFAMIVEGPSDMILLPTMLRASANCEFLGYQVVPGLSIADRDRLALIDHESPRTVYLTDADDGGAHLRRLLARVGVPDSRVLSLRMSPDHDTVLEDLIHPVAYVAAVNSELARSHGDSVQVTVEEVGAHNRPRVVEKFCEARGIAQPNKRAIAYHLLEGRRENQFLGEGAAQFLKELHGKIRTVFE